MTITCKWVISDQGNSPTLVVNCQHLPSKSVFKEKQSPHSPDKESELNWMVNRSTQWQTLIAFSFCSPTFTWNDWTDSHLDGKKRLLNVADNVHLWDLRFLLNPSVSLGAHRKRQEGWAREPVSDSSAFQVCSESVPQWKEHSWVTRSKVQNL